MLVLLLAIGIGACGKNSSVSLGSDLEVAAREYQRANFKDALEALDRFEKSTSPTVESLDLRGCILLEEQKLDEAKAAFEAAHVASPEIFAPRIHLGDLMLRQKKFAEARDSYQQLLKETNILMSNERLRFAVLLTYLGEGDETGAKQALDAIKFPTESACYYFAQAAWAFAHNRKSEGQDWVDKAQSFHSEEATTWYAQQLYRLGWLHKKPPLSKAHN